jgi:NadR type nicotinamide-nucleotide adenylyltransferase
MTARFAHGLVVGKFYPPHVGHLRLVTTAAERCERVTVVVAAASWESLDLGRRVDWLGWHAASMPHVSVVGVMDDHPVDYDDPVVWEAHMAVFLAAADEVAAGVAIDAVFTGEDYGSEMARRLGAEHVQLERPGPRPSGTALREDPSAAWDDLLPAARVGLAHRIVVVGAESTGTTTLARQVADHFGGAFVPEYGRTWSAAKLADARARSFGNADTSPALVDLVWTSAEFTRIAARQTAEIDRAATERPTVVADTDALATSVWHDRYVGGPHQPALDLANQIPPDLYLLTTADGVPFVDDGLRDGEHVRVDMTRAFEAALESCGVPWSPVSGDRETRLAQAIRLVDDLLARPRFPPHDLHVRGG